MPSEVTILDINTDINRNIDSDALFAIPAAKMALSQSAIYSTLSNEKWQKDTKTDVNPGKMQYYRQVVEGQITRILEDKLKDANAILEKQVGIDYNFIVQLNELHNTDVKLSSLKQQLRQYRWLKQSLLETANLPFIQNNDEQQDAPVKDLEHALPFLGVNAAQVIIPHALLKHCLHIASVNRLPDIERKLLNYGLSLASTAYQIAARTCTGDAKAAYTGGILKGISYIVVYKLFLETYGEVLEANIALARKQLNKNLLDGMNSLVPQRSSLSRLFESKADAIARDLLYIMSGKYLKMHNRTHWAAKNQSSETKYQQQTAGTGLAIEQAESVSNAWLLLKDKVINEQEARQQLATVGIAPSLAELLLKQRSSSLSIFRNNRGYSTVKNHSNTAIAASSNSGKVHFENTSHLSA